jgi:hypothetical protein
LQPQFKTSLYDAIKLVYYIVNQTKSKKQRKKNREIGAKKKSYTEGPIDRPFFIAVIKRKIQRLCC